MHRARAIAYYCQPAFSLELYIYTVIYYRPLPFFRAGANPAVRDASSWLPLHYAADRAHYDCVAAILTVQEGLCGLRSAADIAHSNGHEQIVELLEKAMKTYERGVCCIVISYL